MIAGNWMPIGLLLVSLLFGYTQALPFRNGTVSVHGLLLGVAAVLLVVAVVQWRRAATRGAIGYLVFAGVFLGWYLLTDVVPREFTTMAPYITTLLVLAFASQSLRMPAADGQVYRKGSAG
jgi:simple sugar transport system permease protein